MSEVAVAFPNDEVSAQIIASRLRAEGIPSRVDRGLNGAWLTAASGQLTVVVDERDAEKARAIVGDKRRG
ncbi:MAG: DUF2007 domain-containing protein [Chloroflexota bacterium]|nr:DUF2007 domain-containing protein [Chloroflexota bacterium]